MQKKRKKEHKEEKDHGETEERGADWVYTV